MTFTTEIYYN